MIPRYARPVALTLVAALVLATVAVTGCSSSPSKSALAVVNGVEISKSAVDTQIAQMKKASPASFEGTTGVEVEKQYRAQVLNSLIQLELIKESAKTLNVSVTTKQIDDYVAQLQQQYGGKTALEAAMKSAGFDLTSLREQITNNLLAEAVSNKITTGTVNVTDAQIKAYYEQNKTQFSTPAQVHAVHILVAATDKKTADSVFAQVKNGGNFAALATKYSTDPGSKDKGGDLGWAAPSAYVAEFGNAVSAMKVGEVRLVKSQYGYHIVKLLGRRASTQQTLAQATNTIRQTLQQNARSAKFNTYISGLQKKAKIQILDAALKKIIDASTAASAGSTSGSSK